MVVCSVCSGLFLCVCGSVLQQVTHQRGNKCNSNNPRDTRGYSRQRRRKSVAAQESQLIDAAAEKMSDGVI